MGTGFHSLLPAEVRRGLALLTAAAGVLVPVTGVTAAVPPPAPSPAAVRLVPAAPPPAAVRLVPAAPSPAADLAATPYVDAAAKLSFVPPSGWVRGPDTSLNPQSDPPDPVLELVRYQLHVGDPTLYAQPIPITSGLVLDAKAVLSVGLVRQGSDLADLAIDPRMTGDEAGAIPGFVTLEDEATYEGLHTLARTYVARDTDRRLVVRAVASADDWGWLLPGIRAALSSLRADPTGPNAPAAAPAPPPPPPRAAIEPQPAAPARDASLEIRGDIIGRAAQLLGTPYVWGGDSPARGMDCSAYVSRAWDVARYTTDSIWAVSDAISKDELRPGDAMNLTIGRDPEGFGHIRLFEAWANASHSAVWVYEETPPRAVHRVVAYDLRYQPIRLDGLSGAGTAALIPAPVTQPVRTFVPAVPRPRATELPHRTFDPRSVLRPVTERPSARPTPTQTRRPATTAPRPAVSAQPRTTQPQTAQPAIRSTATVAPRVPTPSPVASPRPRG